MDDNGMQGGKRFHNKEFDNDRQGLVQKLKLVTGSVPANHGDRMQYVSKSLHGALVAGALVAGALVTPVHAAPVASWSTTDATTWSNLVDFESAGPLADNTAVSNQFQSLGVSFTGSVRANSCGTNYWNNDSGLAGTTLNTYGPGCETNFGNETFSMKFAADVSAVRWDAFLYDPSVYYSLAGRNTFSLYNDGQLVATLGLIDASYTDLAANQSVSINNRTFQNFAFVKSGFLTLNGGGQVFDELRYTEVNAAQTQTYLVFDNLRFNYANAVPEPTGLALVGIALLAAGAARRRR